MQQDPVVIMADTFLRIVTVDVAHLVAWGPFLLLVVIVHAVLSKRLK